MSALLKTGFLGLLAAAGLGLHLLLIQRVATLEGVAHQQ